MVDLSHIRRFDVVQALGPYQMDEVVLFNAERITQKEALRFVEAGEYNENVLCIPKKQWVALFRNGVED